MLSEKFTFCFKITIKWNLTKSHAKKNKQNKQNKQNIISCDKSVTLKMNELQQNELISRLII